MVKMSKSKSDEVYKKSKGMLASGLKKTAAGAASNTKGTSSNRAKVKYKTK